ncbi:unnamed protein product [Lymnaea stagnalis]|uniref:Uncharacterized protein n=1 Tax=Lymnaea stagnalis TaxID=6523 RepID=A0AAV2IJB9_LYMST
MDTRPGRTTLGIVGTGNFAVALSKRLTMAGYDVVMGSRRPEARQTSLGLINGCLCGVELTSIRECIHKSDIIFVAIHKEDFGITLKPFDEETQGKILIDVSNREYRYAIHSNAEHLASVLPKASVVKAFNSISAYTMESYGDSAGNQKVFIASNDPGARAKVGDIAKTIGFRVVDMGGLKSALFMEEFVLKVFSHWKVPLFLTFGIFNLWSLYIVYIYFIEATQFSWEQVFLKVLNKPLCMTAITVLALTYLPGQLASICQVYYGTKHRPFPRVLDTWLKSRKQFGLIGFILATFHTIASALMMSPTYYSSWYHKVTITVPANSNLSSHLVLPVSQAWMVWKGEAALLAGLTGFILLAVIAVTSIPSVGESLNWSEWRCVHSKLSLAVLLTTVGHVCIMGAPGWAKAGPLKSFKSITLLSILLPMLVIVLRLIFSCPPLSGYLRKIRRGWERGSGYQVVPSASVYNTNETSKASYTGIPLEASCECDNSARGQLPCVTHKTVTANSQCDCSV